MPNPKGEALVKVTARIYLRDRDKLKQYFPHTGYNFWLREVIRKGVEQLDRKLEEKIKEESHGPRQES
jgi:hypothetical protein